MTDTDPFLVHRNLLFTVAYEMLGSAADAEDVLQEAWLRWADADRSQVRDARAYLVRITTRLALNRLRTTARRREVYVGPWLPEPLLTAPDVADDVELADSVSTAMLVVLGTLPATERAVFILREVFDLPYGEIAETLGKTPDAIRQIALRARRHVADRRPRQRVDPAQHREITEQLMNAVVTGDLDSLMRVLAPDVVLVTDGGGVKKAALRPIQGVEKVLRFIAGVTPKDAVVHAEPVLINGHPGVQFLFDGEIDTVVTTRVEDGVVTALYLVRNPAKLERITQETPLTR
ncbi:RNA polymerase sigma-70 factor [Blastococcus sp. Marseille-P5729]|uniref:RNA polymerase sigma-70 factor n=1 Tax=Blastococcus sp. Marseille-P5729 TaxID=2086582 RepID=UPI000D108EE3|nr:RNA polymerase sigma-70 factor [Blastococcus sp. Marseille-P5729]